MSILALFPVLFMNITDGWVLDIYGGIRQTMLSQTQNIVPLSLMIAGILCVIKLAKLSYTIMSDEKDAGFAGITLWELLRPVIILILVGAAPFVVRLFDTVTDAVSTSICRTVKSGDIISSRGHLLAEIEKYETEEASLMYQKAKEATDNRQAVIDNAVEEEKKSSGAKPYAGMMGGESGWTNMTPLLDSLLQEQRLMRQRSQALEEAMKNYNGASKKIRKQYQKLDESDELPDTGTPKTFFTSICMWLSDKLAYCMIAFADIMLCCMVVVFPLALALSILDKWKDAPVAIAGKYLEVSMWKVTANVILSVSAHAYVAAVSVCRNSISSYFSQAAMGQYDSSYATNSTTQLIVTTISIASVFATLSIPSITSTILSLVGSPVSGGDSAKGVATGILMAPGKALGGVAKGGSTIAKLR